MKWFKHDSNANTDAKLRKLRIKYGMEGYGLYWYCLELIAQNVDKNNLTFELEHDAEIISHDTGIHVERVQEMMTSMVNLGLFENNNGAVTCLKMAIRLDETTSKNVQIKQLQDQIRINSRQSPDSLPTQSGDSPARIDKNRTEEKRTEEKTPSRVTAQPVVDGLDVTAWERWIDYRKQIRKPLKPVSIPAAQKELAAFGCDQAAVVQNSIANGYQGLFPPKNGAANHGKPSKLQIAAEAIRRSNPERYGTPAVVQDAGPQPRLCAISGGPPGGDPSDD